MRATAIPKSPLRSFASSCWEVTCFFPRKLSLGWDLTLLVTNLWTARPFFLEHENPGPQIFHVVCHMGVAASQNGVVVFGVTSGTLQRCAVPPTRPAGAPCRPLSRPAGWPPPPGPSPSSGSTTTPSSAPSRSAPASRTSSPPSCAMRRPRLLPPPTPPVVSATFSVFHGWPIPEPALAGQVTAG